MKVQTVKNYPNNYFDFTHLSYVLKVSSIGVLRTIWIFIACVGVGELASEVGCGAGGAGRGISMTKYI